METVIATIQEASKSENLAEVKISTSQLKKACGMIAGIRGMAGSAGQTDHLRPEQADHLGRFKLTTQGRAKLTT